MSALNSMQSMFKSYYSLTPNDSKKLWSECFFAVDANVLLNLYRFPIGARKDLLRVLTHFKERLWLPHQAALEYQRNRAGVLAEQVGRFGAVISAMGKVDGALNSDLDKLQLRKRHSSIDPDKLLSKIRAEITSAKETLEAQRQKQEKEIAADQLRTEIEGLFEGRVGTPFSLESLTEIYKEGVTRYQHSRPPGYLDQEKAKEPDGVYYFDGLPIHRQYGDLLVWKQLLAEAKQRKAHDLIFVTDDDKEDWWFESGGRTIGPRPELVEEARIEAGVQRFNMYSSERFIEYAREHLKLTIQADSIREIREAKILEDNASSVEPRMHALERWLSISYAPGADMTSTDGEVIDFVIREGKQTHGIIAVPKANDLAIKLASQRVKSAVNLPDLSDVIVLIGSVRSIRLRELRQSPLISVIKKRATVLFAHLKKRPGAGYTIDQVDAG